MDRLDADRPGRSANDRALCVGGVNQRRCRVMGIRTSAIVCGAACAGLAFGRVAMAALALSTAGVAVTQNFDAMGTGTTMTGLNASGWKLSASAGSTTFTGGLTGVANVQSAVLTQISNFGTYNFADMTNTTDRGLGFLMNGTTGVNGPRSIMVEMKNSTGQVLTELAVAWDWEKYRNGQSGLQTTFFHGADGSTWTADTRGDQLYTADTDFLGQSPPGATGKSFTVSGLSIASGDNYYLRWTLAGTAGSTNVGAVGIDNVSVTGLVASVPEAGGLVLGAVALASGGAFAAGGSVWRRMRRRRPKRPLDVAQQS